MSASSENQRVSIYSRGDIAQEVGFLIMFSANLEVFLIPTLAALLDCDTDTATTITQKIDNISAKLSIAFAMAELKPTDAKAAALLSVKADILSAIALRNKLAHSLYGITYGDNTVTLVSNMTTDRRGKPQQETLSPERLHESVERLRKALNVIEEQIGVPPSFARYSAQARAFSNKRAQASQKPGKHQSAQ